MSVGDVSLPPDSCVVTTPLRLAQAMVSSLASRGNGMWLDPCVGSGVFLQAIASAGVDRDHVVAIDVQSSMGPNDHLAHTLRGRDFLAWSRQTQTRFDCIVANPPYVAISKLPADLRASALAITTPAGAPVSLGANYWYAFLCASLQLLKVGGRICFVLPAAWEYADYAAELRNTIHNLFSDVEVHRSREPLFETVRDGCVVLVASGYGEKSTRSVRFEHEDAEDLIARLLFSRESPTKTPSPGQPTGVLVVREISSVYPTHRLRDVMRIELGGVTGDASFFLLTESERLYHQLPTHSCLPVLTRARHLDKGSIDTTDWRSLKDKDERVWLFRPSSDLLRDPRVQAYLALPEDKGGCHRMRRKVRSRVPWFLTPLPNRVDGFISGTLHHGPWLTLNLMPELSATNTLYTVQFLDAESLDERAAWGLALLTTVVQEQVSQVRRVYPDGLRKLEPGDLLDLALPTPRRIEGAYRRHLEAVDSAVAGDRQRSAQLADNWFSSDS